MLWGGFQKSLAFAIKNRYQFYTSEQVVSSATLYLGRTLVEGDVSFDYQIGTINTDFYLDRSTYLNFHLGILKFHLGNTTLSYPVQSASGLFIVPGIGFQKYFGKSFGLSAEVTYLFRPQLLLTGTRFQDASNLLIRTAVFPWQLLFLVKPSTSTELNLGALGVYGSSNSDSGKLALTPYLGFSWSLP
jgi:hypothetical protein